MSFLGWMAFVSGLLMLMALVSSYVRDLPVTTSAVYLLVGIVLGPLGVGAVSLDLVANAKLVERITEVAIVIALFVGGLKLRLRPSDPAWRAAFMLAGPVMILTVAGIAATAHLAFDLPLSAALLLGASSPPPIRSSRPRSPSPMRGIAITCASVCRARRVSTTAPRFRLSCSR